MEKIPTAEEFLQDKLSEIHDKEIFEDLLQKMFTVDVSDVMKEFARLHVEAALKEASKVHSRSPSPEPLDSLQVSNRRYDLMCFMLL